MGRRSGTHKGLCSAGEIRVGGRQLPTRRPEGEVASAEGLSESRERGSVYLDSRRGCGRV